MPWLIVLAVVLLLPLLLAAFICRHTRRRNLIAFFHPYCNAGGGGERVLWCAIRALKTEYPKHQFVIYTGDTDVTLRQILDKARDRFNIDVDNDDGRISLCYLHCRRIVEADLYPVCTMVLQSLGGLFLGVEALCRSGSPSVFIDTMGYPFTLPLFRLIAGAKVVAYVHYPVISTDMLDVVAARQSSFNNNSAITRSYVLSHLKLVYYRLFAFVYGLSGRACHITFVNSTWTRDHIKALWPRPANILYPPCDIETFTSLAIESEALLEDKKEVRILSIGQFRPEKNHRLQIETLALLIRDWPSDVDAKPMLVMAGSCRHKEDRERVAALESYATSLSVTDNIDWQLNISFSSLCDHLARSLVGLHTMTDEHFGIGVVEGMCAGGIMVAHDSAGPKMDIILDDSMGRRASDAEGYKEAILEIIRMSKSQRHVIRATARKHAKENFGQATFEERFVEGMRYVLNSIRLIDR